ncbi:glycerate kinase [Brevundimonas sp. GCM10030266]|uniref:glycerate kinase type-2 family protein n=1 Tax=Brevundimonas sp. GCM10030266 TaxID=3273386 RepID=UPI00360D83A6
MKPDPGADLSPQGLLRHLFDVAVAAAMPRFVLPSRLPSPPAGRTVVVGAGKAAAEMACALEAHWTAPLSGLVIVPHGPHSSPSRITVLEAAHPVADAAGVAATRALVGQLHDLTADDLVICLLSGGGSALMCAPAPGITLADKQAVTRTLLRSGATISEINTVRKHISAVKGGRLAELARPARLVTLAISDVPGDDPSVLASGPTLPDATTRAEALEILARHALDAPESVQTWLADPRSETPGPDPAHPPDLRLIATADQALAAAAVVARVHGYAPVVLGGDVEGAAEAVAVDHATLVRRILAGEGPVQPPCVILSGGETTVSVRGAGRGGRNTQFLLALALALGGEPGVHALAADTDGVDGSEDNAGARIGPDVLNRARALALAPQQALARTDAWSFFDSVGGLVVTGPTGTNVNDFRAILIEGPPASPTEPT